MNLKFLYGVSYTYTYSLNNSVSVEEFQGVSGLNWAPVTERVSQYL